MSEISAEGYAVALRPLAGRFAELGEQGDRPQADLDAKIVEQAKGLISARLGTTPDVAFEILSGLACSQGRSSRGIRGSGRREARFAGRMNEAAQKQQSRRKLRRAGECAIA
jgi:hypothetical protein